MIYGLGTDIVEVKRFNKYVKNQKLLDRFYNKAEQDEFSSEQKASEHYASRFAVKEAFAKAMGTGLVGFEFSEVYTIKDSLGKPEIKVEGKAREILDKNCPNSILHVSISHEKEYAVAYVVIEHKE